MSICYRNKSLNNNPVINSPIIRLLNSSAINGLADCA
jgi:hypothetical protein